MTPLSYAQQRVWFSQQLDPASPVYNVYQTWRIRGALGKDVLEGALQAIVRRHSALRTVVQVVDGVPCQAVVEPFSFELSVNDLRGCDPEDREAVCTESAREAAKTPFDLSTGPLLRATLWRLGDEDHVLLLNMHHIITDGVSFGVIHRELGALYGAMADGNSLSLPKLPLEYGDYAASQQTCFEGDRLDELLGYWKEQLAGLSPLQLPTDRTAGSWSTFRGGWEGFSLGQTLSGRLKSLSRDEGVSLFTTLLACFKILLSRYIGQTDIAVGTFKHGRTSRELMPLVGMFVNTLVLRTDLSGEPGFRQFLQDVRKTCKDAFVHEELPFDRLVEELQPERQLGRNPLFQVGINYQATIVGPDLPGLEVSSFSVGRFSASQLRNDTAKFDFEVSWFVSEDDIEGVIEYSTDVFDASTIRRAIEHLRTLMDAVVANPSQPISQLPLLDADERRQLLEDWNGNRQVYPTEDLIHERLEAQAARTPEATAVAFEEERLSYQQLNRRANRLAHYLRKHGVGPGVLVGLCIDRSLEMVVGILGILKAGGAYVPLDTAHPQDRLSFILRDARVSTLVTQESLVERFTGQGLSVIRLDAAGEFLARESTDNPQWRGGADSPAYVIYTSGSTGRPKGVLVTHANVSRLFDATQSWYHFDANDVWTLFHSYAFDFSVWELWGALFHGGKVVVVPYWISREPEAFHALLVRERVTVLNQTPSAFRQLIRADQSADVAQDLALRLVIFGGEALDLQSLRPWFERHGDEQPQLVNMYGITETTVHVTYRPLTLADVKAASGSLIGRPIPDLQVYVLDRHLQPLPIGIPGELYVGGAGLGMGYLDRPGLTAERFLPDPFGPIPGARLYKTGDLVRFRPDGGLEYLGRIDHQVKIRGFRIELGEIESVLGELPEIAEVVVLVREDTPEDKRIVAYIVPSGGALSSNDLRQSLKQRLPDYMVPPHFVMLDALPLTPNGKLDRRALPAPESVRPELDAAYQAPRGQVEETLAEIWTQLLNIDQVGRHDNFFELGGDSILGIQIVAKASQAGLTVTARHIFEHQTIAGLAEVVETHAPTVVDQRLVTGPLPLAPIQHWFFARQFKHRDHWNMGWVLESREPLHPERIARVLDVLMRHHDALRLRFAHDRDGWQQELGEPDERTPFSFIDLSKLPGEEAEEAYALEADRLHGSLNLADGPIIRVALFRFDESVADRVLFVVHHLAIDGISWRILLEEFQTAYDQLSSGEAIDLPSKTTSIKDWTERLTEYALSDALKDEMAYWQTIAEEPSTPLPRDFSDGVHTVASTRTVAVELGREDTQALLQNVPEVYRTQINDVLLTALVDALSAWTGQETLSLHLEGHGREQLFDDVDVSRTVGWFTTIFPVLLRRGRPDHPGELLKSLKEQLRRIPHRGIGYGLLCYLRNDQGLRDRTGQGPGPEIAFNYLGQFDQMLASDGRWVSSGAPGGAYRHPENKQPHLITVVARVANGLLQVHWNYSEAVHRRETIERLASDYQTSLLATIRHCQSPEAGGYTPSDFPLAGVGQADLDMISRPDTGQARSRIADLYPLAPLQQGLWFHELLDPSAGAYFVSNVTRIDGPLSRDAFRRAWETVVARHAILRTRIVWHGLENPLQLVQASVELPWAEQDWRNSPAELNEARLSDFLDTDRERGLDLARAPLMRLTLFRIEDHSAILVWSFHHLILDRWSVDLVLQEVWAAYEAQVEGHAPQLPSPRPYRDYLQWLQGRELDQAEGFWRRSLAGFTAPTVLGIDQAPGTKAPYQADAYDFREVTLSEDATAGLSRWARQHQLTANTLLQGAWSLLISRYSGTEDIVFGATASGRSAGLSGIESTVGLFINTLPVRAYVSPGDTLVDWLRALQAQQAALREYEYTPLVDIQKWSEVPAGEQLFNTLLVFENTPQESDGDQATKATGLDVQAMPGRGGDQSNYPLALIVIPGSTLRLRFTYDTRHYTGEAIDRMLGHLQQALAGMVRGSGQPRLGDIPLLTEAERHQLLVGWNADRRTFPAESGVHERFEAQVARTPEATAAVFEDERLTYAQLNRRANQLAHHLRGLGVVPGALVGLCVDRSLEMVVGILGILKAGGAYVPLDTAHPQDRLSFILKDARVSVLLTQENLAERFAGTDMSVICLDTNADEMARESAENLRWEGRIDSPAYVIYTSGSTGRPKGVLVSHANVVRLFEATQSWYHFDEKDVWTLFHSYGFDFSVWELWGALLNGGKVVVVPYWVSRAPDAFYQLLIEERVTVLNQTPSAFRQLIQAEEAADVNDELALRLVIFGGEALDLQSLQPWFERHGDEQPQLVNMYGITETTVHVTYRPLTAADVRGASGSLIGRPIPDLQVYVLDQSLQPVPIGVPGEMYVGGAGLALGYLDRPGLTAERFLPDPFGAVPGARLYKTGDLVRYRSDGDLEYLGRIDHQVKIRGFRIELGEIESVLASIPAVRETVVVVRGEGAEDQRIVAYVVPSEGPLSAPELRQNLKEHLPDYMVPAHFVMLDALPLTPNGKVDRRALPEPVDSGIDRAGNYEPPRDPVEEILVQIWEDLLRVKRVGVYDNFFDLGGHSLLAAKIVTRLKTTFTVDIPLRTLFDSPTIAGLSEALASARRGGVSMETAGMVPVSRADTLPLSFAQERFWLLDQIHTNRSVFNSTYGFRLEGPFRAEIFRQSFQALVDRHEILRTSFASLDGEPLQVIVDELSAEIPLEVFPGLSEEERVEVIRQASDDERRWEFDLSHCPVFRIRILRFAEDDHCLLLTLHHIINDAWSLEVIIKDLGAAYAAGCEGGRSTLPALPVQYVDYAHWQRQLVEGPAGQEQLAYWKKELSNLPPALPLPTDYERPAVQTFRGTMENLRLPTDLVTALRSLNREEGTTHFMVLLAAMQFLLHRLTGANDIILGSPVAGRDRAELQGMIGCFLNTLVLRTELSGSMTGRDLLKRVREVVLSAYENQDVPFEKILAEIDPVRDMKRTPVFQVMLNMHLFDDRSLPLPELSVSRASVTYDKSLFDMTLYFAESDEGVVVSLAYNTDLFAADRMKDFVQQFAGVLGQIVDEPDRPLNALTLVTPVARSYLPDPRKPIDAAWEGPVWGRLERHVREQGERVAISGLDGNWTYRDLEARSNRMAHTLLEQGLKAHDVVAIYAARSSELAMALLGVLKAGAAFMVLDPAYPPSRLLEMLQIARPSGLVLLEAAGPLPDELEDWASGLPYRVRLPAFGASVADDEEIWGSTPETPPSVEIRPDDVAYVTFTSGSTGTPKCLLGTHRPLSHFVNWYARDLRLTTADRVTMFSGLAHDPLLRDVFTPLWIGGTLCVPDEEDLATGRVGDWLRDQEVTLIHLTPALAGVLSAARDRSQGTCSSLRYAVLGGDRLRPSHIESVRQFAPQATCVNAYGATETPQIVSFYFVPPGLASNVAQVPIGRGVDGVQVLVLNEAGQPAGIGELGEIYIRTPYLTQGYVNDETLTSNRFMPNPFRSDAGDRVYRTGDMGRLSPDGNFEFVGRRDSQVKIRGFRVEVGEVEAALGQHAAIHEVVVVPGEDAPGDRYLVAYLVTAEDASPSISELRSFLQRNLPDYMIPTAFVFLEKLPRTPNGKLDHGALPGPDVERARLQTEFVAPQTPTEKKLAKIWQDVLQRDRVGIHDNFFDLGGHSLLATQVIARVRDSVHIDLKLRHLFDVPTLKDLAGMIEILGASKQDPGSSLSNTDDDRSEIVL